LVLPPGGEVVENKQSYGSGELSVVNLDADGTWVTIEWAAGAVTADDLPATIETDRVRGTASTAASIKGPDGQLVPTIVNPNEDGTNVTYSVLTCGSRRVFVRMGGRDVAARQAAVVQSFVCRPDPAQEPSPGVMRLALALPNFYTQPNGRLLGQLNLTDGKGVNIIMLEDPPTTSDSAFDPRPHLNWLTELKLGDVVGARVPFTGHDRGAAVTGFIVEKRCATFTLSVTVYTPTARAAALAALVAPVEQARCLDEHEPPPSWPDRP
jgi:hypothetical protein